MFTDEDLKALKKMLSDSQADTDPRWELIARLEAAEAYILSNPEDVTDENFRLYKEWRKTMGPKP
jgi:hypothetical protein